MNNLALIYKRHGLDKPARQLLTHAARWNNRVAMDNLEYFGWPVPYPDLFMRQQAGELVGMLGIIAIMEGIDSAPQSSFVDKELHAPLRTQSAPAQPAVQRYSSGCLGNGDCDPGQTCFITQLSAPYGKCIDLVDRDGMPVIPGSNVAPVRDFQCSGDSECPAGFRCQPFDDPVRGFCTR